MEAFFYRSIKFIQEEPIMKKFLLSIALAVSCAPATSAPKTHDGFFLSGTFGFGYGNFLNEFQANGVKMESKGTQIETGLKIGGAIIQNFILHGTIDINGIFDDISFSDKSGNESTLTIGNNKSFRSIFLGAGITYYIPGAANVFFSASAGISDYTEICIMGEIVTNYDPNFSFNLSAGKEWWVNNELGIGVALSFNHYSAKSKIFDYEGKVSFNSISAVATFTFN